MAPLEDDEAVGGGGWVGGKGWATVAEGGGSGALGASRRRLLGGSMIIILRACLSISPKLRGGEIVEVCPVIVESRRFLRKCERNWEGGERRGEIRKRVRTGEGETYEASPGRRLPYCKASKLA